MAMVLEGFDETDVRRYRRCHSQLRRGDELLGCRDRETVVPSARAETVKPPREAVERGAGSRYPTVGLAILPPESKPDFDVLGGPAHLATAALVDAAASVCQRAGQLHAHWAALNSVQVEEILTAMHREVSHAAGIIEDLVRAWLPLDAAATVMTTTEGLATSAQPRGDGGG